MKWTRCVVELSEAEEVTLQQLSINHRHRDTRTRAAGLLLLGRKIKPKVIAGQLGVGDQSVYNWSVRHEVACRSCPHGNGGDHPCHRVNL
jgi:hypothetical protein